MAADSAGWPPLDRTRRLRGLADAQFQESKLWYLVVTYLYIAAAALGGFAYFTDESQRRLQVITIVAVSCQLVAVAARLRAIRLHALAHEADWRALIMDGMGPTRAEEARALMLENLLADGARARAGDLGAYYGNDRTAGPPRLIADLRETAYFTGCLYRAASHRAVWLAAVVIAVPLGGPVYSVVTARAIPSSVAVVAVSFVLPLWDVIGRIRTWRASANVLDRVASDLASVTDMRDTLPLLIDAVIATATASPIPRRIYDEWNSGLRERWAQLEELARDPDPDAPSEEGRRPDPDG